MLKGFVSHIKFNVVSKFVPFGLHFTALQSSFSTSLSIYRRYETSLNDTHKRPNQWIYLCTPTFAYIDHTDIIHLHTY